MKNTFLLYTFVLILLYKESASFSLDFLIRPRFGESECDDLIPFTSHCDQRYAESEKHCKELDISYANKCDRAFNTLTGSCKQHELAVLKKCGLPLNKCTWLKYFLDDICNRACDKLKNICTKNFNAATKKCAFIFDRLAERCDGVYSQYKETCELNIDPYKWSVGMSTCASI